MQPYAPRRICFCGLRQAGSWSLKLYSVAHDQTPIDWPRFEPGLQLAERELPPPDARAGRPGLGLLIAHQGATGDYVVLGWWDHENELPLRVWVRRQGDPHWRRAQDGESVCVWDLEIIWSERQAWVQTMLSGSDSNPSAYIDSVDERFRAATEAR